MENARPGYGFYPFARFLETTCNNLVITTNFDSLIEDSLFIYTQKRPIVVSHESLTEYIVLNQNRPIIAKIHRGLFFQPLNRTEDMKELSDQWVSVLRNAFKGYTPVVIGYGGRVGKAAEDRITLFNRAFEDLSNKLGKDDLTFEQREMKKSMDEYVKEEKHALLEKIRRLTLTLIWPIYYV